jgi:hypothetical protein
MIVDKPTPVEPVRQAWEPRYTPEKAREVCQRFWGDGIRHVRVTLDTTGEYGGKGSFWVEGWDRVPIWPEVEAPFDPPMVAGGQS